MSNKSCPVLPSTGIFFDILTKSMLLFRNEHHNNHWNQLTNNQLFQKKKETQPKATSMKRLELNTLQTPSPLHSNQENTRLNTPQSTSPLH